MMIADVSKGWPSGDTLYSVVKHSLRVATSVGFYRIVRPLLRCANGNLPRICQLDGIFDFTLQRKIQLLTPYALYPCFYRPLLNSILKILVW